jgi:DNA-binding HxlR family transcriptional regulator
MDCGVARALEVLGDWWTLLVVREAFFGSRRFADFERHLPIAKNILSRRLQHLVEHGVMERVDAGVSGPRFEYQLTEKGRDLLTVLTALRQWSDRWEFGEGHEPVLVVDRRTGEPVPPLRVTDRDGRELRSRDLRMKPGPEASPETLERFGRPSRSGE